MAQAATISAPVDLALKAGNFRLTLPEWGAWLDILDRAARGQSSTDRADPEQLLLAWLSATATCDTGDGFKPIRHIADLPAALADQLMAAGTTALAAQNSALKVATTATEHGRKVTATAYDFTLSPLSFAARNACLRQALVIENGDVQIHASQYELSLVARSTVESATNAPVDISALRALPIVVGEALITAARALSDPAAETELGAFEKAGLVHPDMELATLCLTFGMTPEQAQNLPAATAKRLNAAARLLAATGAPVAAVADNVTQIVIQGD